MANPEHLAKLMEGVERWNRWKGQNPEVRPDLNEADLEGAKLMGADLSGAHFSKAKLSGADLSEADLFWANLNNADLHEADLARIVSYGADFRGANLRGANLLEANLEAADFVRANLHGAHLTGAYLEGADLSEADLSDADLREANLSHANLSRASLSDANLGGAYLPGADLQGADLTGAILVDTDLGGTNLTDCSVFGISVWNVNLEGAIQSNLLITLEDESPIRVDNLEVAQFIYLLLNNEKIRDVIDTIGKKAVLVLGRFTPDRKAVLDAIREALRHHGYLPILFDFEKPSTRDTQETIVTLAGMARFIIADITDPKSIPQELASIVPNLPSVPVQPVLQTGYEPWGMYDHIKRYGWVLPIVLYENQEALLTELESKVIVPSEEKAKEQTRR